MLQICLFILGALLLATFAILDSFARSRTGWSALAEQFRATRKPTGQSLPWQNVRVGWMHFQGRLDVIIANEGLYLRPWRFSFFPALLVAWDAFSLPVARTTLGITNYEAKVRVADGRIVRL